MLLLQYYFMNKMEKTRERNACIDCVVVQSEHKTDRWGGPISPLLPMYIRTSYRELIASYRTDSELKHLR